TGHGDDRRVGQEDTPRRRGARGSTLRRHRRRDRVAHHGGGVRLPGRAAVAHRRAVQPGALQPRAGEGLGAGRRRHRRSREHAGGGLAMAEAIYLPKVGMTMEEGTLTQWAIADGAPVARRQVVFEMESEKVQMEIEAEHDGTLKQLVPEGAVLKPGDVVGCILVAGEEVPQALLDRVAQQMALVPGAG